MKTIAIIPGSTRPSRISRQVADWIMTTPKLNSGLHMEIVDLAVWNLPMLNEPGIPAYGHYTHEHTKAWSRAISGYAGFVFVTPQYNWGYPAPLKNALDYLYTEWHDKPAVILSYGGHGGGKAAAQLRQVLEGLKMRPAATSPEITLSREMYGDDGLLKEIDSDLDPYVPAIQAALDELLALLQLSQTDELT